MKTMDQFSDFFLVADVAGVGVSASEGGDVLSEGAAAGEIIGIVPTAHGFSWRGQSGAHTKAVQKIVIGDGQVKFTGELCLRGQRSTSERNVMIREGA